MNETYARWVECYENSNIPAHRFWAGRMALAADGLLRASVHTLSDQAELLRLALREYDLAVEAERSETGETK